MRGLFFDLLMAAGLLLLVICGVQGYHLFFADDDPAETMMNKYGSPSAGNPSDIQAEWDDLDRRAKIFSIREIHK